MPVNNPDSQTADETTQLLTQLTRIGWAIDKELTLISERMSWFVISESFNFSAFSVAVANHEQALVLYLLVWIMPLVGTLLAVCVYPSLLAANSTANRLKGLRDQFELKLPEALRVKLAASKREPFWGSVRAFVIPVMLALVWGVILIVAILMPWRTQLASVK